MSTKKDLEKKIKVLEVNMDAAEKLLVVEEKRTESLRAELQVSEQSRIDLASAIEVLQADLRFQEALTEEFKTEAFRPRTKVHIHSVSRDLNIQGGDEHKHEGGTLHFVGGPDK